MNKKLVTWITLFVLTTVIAIFYGCNETRTAQRIPPPPPQPPRVEPTPSPVEPPPKVVQVPPTPKPEEKQKPVVQPKPPKPKITYVVIKAPVGILGSSKIDVLAKPDPKSIVIARVISGAKMQLLTVQGTWMKVKTPEGKIGWISSSYVAR